ncbi:class I SAM-dependent methyltransferase [Neisseria wadsworthii]|uniref:Thiopurine S-methyltransferase n=1 Tax=Neisseria wadsworthii 9715 TaxID=1030841 RepID=G4CPR3_9NEIS|nr:class I SAM-dependent methyltransferase [Neisseria wadsworthii]EGZ47420.1 thiopurine S-methyltransferase [Neisseria wadsworthii 9715]
MYKWDERYDTEEFVFGTEPNDFILEILHHLPKQGRALDLATGEGRNAAFLAQHGLEVLGVDLSDVGLQKAKKLAELKGVRFAIQQADLTEFDFPQEHYAVITNIFCHFTEPNRSEVYRRVIDALEPGGLFVGVFYHPEQIMFGTGGPSDPTMLGTLRDMVDVFGGLEWIVAEHVRREVYEGSRHTGQSSLIRLLGRKPL